MIAVCQRVKEYLHKNPNCSYQQIADGANIHQSMVTNCLRVLIRDGEIARKVNKNNKGRIMSDSYEVLK